MKKLQTTTTITGMWIKWVTYKHSMNNYCVRNSKRRIKHNINSDGHEKSSSSLWIRVY